MSETSSNPIAFPTLTPADIASLHPLAQTCTFSDGQTIFHAGQSELDLFVVQSGSIEIINPADHNRHIVTHTPGHFAGDIDLLTRRPVIVTGIARGHTTLLRITGPRLRELLSKLPSVSEKLLIAIQERRRLLTLSGVAGIKVVGPGKCRDTMLVREFLFKNFVPFTWLDSASPEGQSLLTSWNSPKKSPVIQCTDGNLLINPTLRELAAGAGVWRSCPTEPVDLAVIGAGPAGMTAAVYAASEGLSVLVLDRLGPGGQAGGSSKIENFIGFPSGLTGAELATRSVLQMLKFGAKIVTPISVDSITPAPTPADFHLLHLNCGTTLRARTILVAAGVKWRKLDAENAEKFESAGIHYACTSVEAILYDNSDVAVVGAGNSAGQAAMFLAECCRNRTVHLLVRKHLGPGMSSYLVNRIRSTPNIKLHENTQVSSVHGNHRLESITLETLPPSNPSPPPSGAGSSPTRLSPLTTNLPLAALFVFIGADPTCSFLPDNIARDPLGYLLTGTDALRSNYWPLTNREPCPLETTLPGILAAGDIRSGSTKRVGFAVGDGSLAVTCIHKLLSIRT
ncbi:MAG TPA: FAD-dependent oxidoreductase [Tepidisphaeraceae bacterium]|jgi:thioredoxin reductase (NADPH)|nr:FAD-dependent oxidoreductase [Tepidisphaeraceae bacterium]